MQPVGILGGAMTEEQMEYKILRLERMVKTLAQTLVSIVGSVNTGSYEYSLHDVEASLNALKPWEYERAPD